MIQRSTGPVSYKIDEKIRLVQTKQLEARKKIRRIIDEQHI